MDDDLRMKLADLGLPEAMAACIVEHMRYGDPPIPVERIAEAVGILEIVYKDTEGKYEGLLVTDDTKAAGSIVVNSRSPRPRQRFTIAHEIGHFLLPSHDSRAQCVKADLSVLTRADARLSKESEANRFAAALLMPKDMYARATRKLGAPDVAHIDALATEFEVSKEAAARRYVQVTDHQCAFVFSRDGKVQNVVRSSDMPLITVEKGMPLPPATRWASRNLARGTASEWREPDLGEWFNLRDGLAGQLTERSLGQVKDFRLTMLVFEPVEDEEEGLEAVDARFRRRSR